MDKVILLVEDDMLIRDLYTIILTKTGYFVDTAEDGEVALTKSMQKAYDLILLDIMLPKVNGFDVLQTLRSKQDYKSHTSPVIVMTNMGEKNILQEMLKMGAAKYLLKAELSNEELINEINSFFEQPQAKN